MALTNCQKCKYLDRNPNHQEDITCGISPAYASAWQRLKSLDEYTCDHIPIDDCRDFQPDPDFEEKELTLSLSNSQWQKIIRSANSLFPQVILEELGKQVIQISVSLPLHQWRDLATSCTPDILQEQLREQGIESDFIEDWIDLDSSCIDAISFNESTKVLKIRFCSGSVYEYFDFDRLKFSDFRNASSHGGFFHREIKGIYQYSLAH